MQVIQHEELDNLELNYNIDHKASILLQYVTSIDMIPFAYEHIADNNVRKIVIMWTAKIDTGEESILEFKADDTYIVEKNEGHKDVWEFSRNLVNYSFAKFTNRYVELSVNHSVKMKDFEVLLQDSSLENHYKLLFELLDAKWQS